MSVRSCCSGLAVRFMGPGQLPPQRQQRHGRRTCRLHAPVPRPRSKLLSRAGGAKLLSRAGGATGAASGPGAQQALHISDWQLQGAGPEASAAQLPSNFRPASAQFLSMLCGAILVAAPLGAAAEAAQLSPPPPPMAHSVSTGGSGAGNVACAAAAAAAAAPVPGDESVLVCLPSQLRDEMPDAEPAALQAVQDAHARAQGGCVVVADTVISSPLPVPLAVVRAEGHSPRVQDSVAGLDESTLLAGTVLFGTLAAASYLPLAFRPPSNSAQLREGVLVTAIIGTVPLKWFVRFGVELVDSMSGRL